MKKFLLTFLPVFFFFYSSFSQSAASTSKKIEKEISLSYVFISPGEFLPSVEFSFRKIISPSFKIGAGLTEIYFRYRERMYIPVFADACIYLGKKKRVGISAQAGYGFFNHTFIGKYVSGPGNVVVKRNGSFYLSAGPKYSFNIKNSKFNCSVNLVSPSTTYNLYIEDIKKTTNYVESNFGINVKFGLIF